MGSGVSGLNNKSGAGGAGKAGNATDQFINEMAAELNRYVSPEEMNNGVIPLSNSDLQAAVEAFAMTHKDVDEDALLNQIRDRSQAIKTVEGVNGYNITASDGSKMEFYFAKDDNGQTFYGNSIHDITNPTPNGWTESQMISRIKSNGGKSTKYKKDDLINKEVEYLADRRETNTLLNNAYARNKVADTGAKAYRNTRKAQKLARR